MSASTESHDTSIVLEITGMSCDHCVGRVRKAIGGVAGVRDSDVRVGSATVRFDSATASTDEITAAVTRAGYPASIMSAT